MPVYFDKNIAESFMNRNALLAKSQEFPKDEGKRLPGLDNIDFESAEDPTLDKIDFESKSIDFESEEPIQMSTVTDREPPGIYMPKERTLFDKFKSLITDPGIDKDRAANITALSEIYGLSPSQAEKHYDELKGFVFEATQPTSRDVAGGLMGAAVTAGVIFNPVATAIGVGTFMGLDELENYIISKHEEDPYHFQEGKGLSDLLKAHGLSKDAIDMLDFMWKIPVAGGTTKFSRGIFGAITSRIKGQSAKARFINKVIDDVKNEGTTPNEAALKNAEEFGIDKDQLLKAQKDKEAKGDLVSEEVENPLEITRPTDAVPTYTFTSQKGNHYEKIGEKWYDGKGREVTNNYVVKAAEKRKVKFEEDEAAVEERVVKDIEEKTGKRIEEVTEEEIDKYYSEELEKAKIYPVADTGLKAPTKTELAKVFRKTPEELANPEATFTSKKGNEYVKVEGKWYTKDGVEVSNKFVIGAAEKGKGETITLYRRGRESGNWWTPEESYADMYGKNKPLSSIKLNLSNLNLVNLEKEKPSWLTDMMASVKPPITGGAESNILMDKVLKEHSYDGFIGGSDYHNTPIYYVRGDIVKKNTKAAEKKAEVKVEEPVVEEPNWEDENIKSELAKVKAIEDHFGRRISEISDKEIESFFTEEKIVEESQTDVDLQTGTEKPVSLQGEKSPFFQNKVKAAAQRKLFAEKGDKINDSPEQLTQKLINDVNRSYHGDKDVDIAKTRGLLDALKDNADDFLDFIDNNGDAYFIRGEDHLKWKETVSEAADWARGLDNLKFKITDEGTKLYSGIPLDEARGIFDRLKRKPKPTPKPKEPFSVKSRAKEIVLERRANLNLANYETNKFINSIEQRLNLDQRESMPFVIEGTDVPKELGRPDLQKVINKDRKLLEVIAAEVKEHFNEGWQKIKKHMPDLSVEQIENYITHLWDIPKHKRAEAVAWFQTQNRFLEKRFVDTWKEGIEKGFRPKTLDVSEIIRIHDNVTNRAIENTKYINALLKLKDQGIYLIQRTGVAPMEWIEVDYPALTRRIPLPKKEAGKKGEFVKHLKVRVHPDLVRPLKAIFEQRFDHPVISAYEALNGILKKSMLTASLFHHGALGETGVALIGPGKTANIMFNPVKIYDALVKGEYDIFTKEAIARDSIEHGVQYGATADIPVSKIQGYLNDLAKGSENIVMVNRITKAMKGINSVWDKALWNYLHDTLKLYGYEAMVSKLNPNMGPAATKMAKREIGQLVNDTFGGQNWDALMMTPKEVQMMTWSLLSADWTFSTTRQALAPTGIGSVYKESANVRKKMGAMFWARAAIYFGIGINGLNVLFRNQDMKENPQYYRDKNLTLIDKTMMGNTIGRKTKLFVGRYKDGSERYLRWGKQFIDFYELIASPIDKLGGKAAPVPQLLSEVFTGHSLSGFKNDDVYGKKGFESAYGIFKTVAKAPIPLALRRMMNDNVEFKPTDVFMPSSKGMSRYRALEYFKKAIVDQDEDLLREVYEGSLRNNLPAYTLFGGALAWTENEVMSDVHKNVEDIKDAEAKLNAASSAYDKRRYGTVLRKLQKEKADKEAGLKLIKTAIERSRIYNELSSDVTKLPRNR